ncbi:MAG: hypothetical protein H7Y32_03775 [Chloroflexales bacterium]|nr:hypothetical protein [Chloroflexales bacterium]
MTPRLRKFALTMHVIASVGWLGAVAAFLPLAIVSLVSQEAPTVRAAALAMGLITTFVIVPLCLASLLSGVISSLGTEWGLFRYYWLIVKLLATGVSTIILLVHTQPIALLEHAAATTAVLDAGLQPLQLQMAAASAVALIVLIVLTALSVYKPRGLTPYGWRKLRAQRAASPAGDATRS